MKKSLLILTMLLTFMWLGVSSQHIVFGPKVGYSSSKWLKSYPDFTEKPMGGFHIGFDAGVEITDKMIPGIKTRTPMLFNFGIYYETRSAKYSHVSGLYDFSMKADYVYVPLFLKFSFETAKNLFINVDLGGYTAWWAKGTWTFGDSVATYNPLPLHWTRETDITFDNRFQQRWEWGLLAGLELEYRLNNISVLLSGRKNWGLSSSFSEDDNFRYRVIEVSAGLRFYF
jgi:hypothetical protein